VKRFISLNFGLPLRIKVLAGISILALGGALLVLRPIGPSAAVMVDGFDGGGYTAYRARANPWTIRPNRLKLIEVKAADIEWLDRQMQPPSQTGLEGYDLRVMAPVDDVGDIPTTGKKLIVVAVVDEVPHIRIFDGDSQMVVDRNVNKSIEQGRPVEDLGRQLEDLCPPHELTAAEKARLIDVVGSIAARMLVSSSYCLHLLRVHGMQGRFERGEPPSGDAILKLLTDDGASSAYFDQRPVVRTPNGVRFPTMRDIPSDNRSMERHRDHTLAALGELGLPLSHPLRVGGGMASLRDVLTDSVANFHLGQAELDWTAIAYALYLPPIRAWANRYGERFSFDELANELERRPMDRASCGGTHLLYALTLLARVNAESPVLSEATRARLVAHLARCVTVLERTQQPDGSWPVWWNHELLPEGHPSDLSVTDDDANRLLMTGHLAEWLLYLPADIPLPQPMLTRTGHWLRTRLLAASSRDMQGAFCPFSHAVCVLKQITYVPQEVAARRPSTKGSSGRTR
jgi:hypothetical protein